MSREVLLLVDALAREKSVAREVVFAALSSVALGVSELSARTLIGGGLIVLAAALSAWPSRPRPLTPA